MVDRTPVLKKTVSIVNYLFYLSIIIIACDVIIFHNILGFGYPRDLDEENIRRYPAPYVAFTGKPNAVDHNDQGFRGPSYKESEPSDLKIAFFGGSTGYKGTPPIARMIESKLNELLNVNVFVANYSGIAANHRQHLHGMLEYLPQFKPDVVIFYGGYNETIQTAYNDPRPGYPYNYYFRGETSPLVKVLMGYSAILGELENKYCFLTDICKLKKDHQPYSDSWNKKILDKYFETLTLANKATSIIGSNKFGKTKFFSFYQPYQVPKKFLSTHEKIKERVNSTKYTYDVSSEYDSLGQAVYTDMVHVKQKAREKMAEKIVDILVQARHDFSPKLKWELSDFSNKKVPGN